MIQIAALVLALVALGFLAWRALRIWQDAARRGFAPGPRLGWSLLGSIVPDRYWWAARLERISPQQQRDLLRLETQRLGLNHAAAQCCPLCGAEVPDAWQLTPVGRLTVASSPVECPHCDFRLDACRHCAHFLPASARAWPAQQWAVSISTEGRCNHYRTWQPVEELCEPQMARQLKKRGYDQVRGPMRVVDSYLPPDTCRAFEPDPSRIRRSGIRWPGPRRAALLRLAAADPGNGVLAQPETTSARHAPAGEISTRHSWRID
jgi:hypothetical protein